MTIGSPQYVIQCKPTPFGTPVFPCTTKAGVSYAPVMIEAYVIDPASGSYLEAVTEPFDYQLASQYFGFGFSGVAGVYLAAYCVGLIVGFIRSH